MTYIRTEEHKKNNRESILNGYRTGKRKPIFLGKKRPDFSLWLKDAYKTGKKTPVSMTGEENPSWKGDNASYTAIHHYAKKHFGDKKVCKFCNTSGKRLEWANTQEKYSRYSRLRKDYISLCVQCHRYYDFYDKEKLEILLKKYERKVKVINGVLNFLLYEG